MLDERSSSTWRGTGEVANEGNIVRHTGRVAQVSAGLSRHELAQDGKGKRRSGGLDIYG